MNSLNSLTDDSAYGQFDHVIFDTAPTGHTIRLLQLPGSWTDFLSTGGDASCLGPLAGLDKHRATYAAAVDALTDPARTRLILVARPQLPALKEIERTFAELTAIGMTDAFVVINGILPAAAGDGVDRCRSALAGGRGDVGHARDSSPTCHEMSWNSRRAMWSASMPPGILRSGSRRQLQTDAVESWSCSGCFPGGAGG